ncbi:MAG: Rrf2 family transcriptional regulator, partial [Deltaproteobacteria bacterium]|nr:Rrf2 family transcriptional regulator [Deltaproteobacteria bacterium]
MRLSTRSRYGTRMMQDLAQHYDKGPVRIGEIA